MTHPNRAGLAEKEIIAKRLEETEALFQETLKLRVRMQAALKQWETSADGAVPSDVCSLIETFVDPLVEPNKSGDVQ